MLTNIFIYPYIYIIGYRAIFSIYSFIYWICKLFVVYITSLVLRSRSLFIGGTTCNLTLAWVKWSFEFTSNISRKVISIKLKFAFKLSHLPSMRTMHETVQFVTHYMYQKINEYRCSEISNLLNAVEVSRNLMRWKSYKYSKVYLSKVVWIKFMIISVVYDALFSI